MSRSDHQPSAWWRHIDDWQCIPMSVKRRLVPDDSSPDDVPEPWEIDPSFFDHLDCDMDYDLDAYGREIVDDGQPYCDAP